MPTIMDTRNVAAATTVTNLLQGSKFEFMGRNSAIVVYSVIGTGGVAGDILMDVTFGSQIVGDSLAIQLEPAAGVGPDRNKNQVTSGVAAAGDRLQIKLQNTTAATALDVRTIVEIRPL